MTIIFIQSETVKTL